MTTRVSAPQLCSFSRIEVSLGGKERQEFDTSDEAPLVAEAEVTPNPYGSSEVNRESCRETAKMSGRRWRAYSKTRIRTQEELEVAGRVLSMTALAFSRRYLPYYLASGTLLGIFRDRALIPWDWDLQFYFRTEDAVDRLDQVCEALDEAGADVLRREVRNPTNEFKIVGMDSGIKVEITSWTESGEFRIRRNSRIPAEIFESVGLVTFGCESFRTFHEIERYLEWCYGDWQTPIRTAKKSLYLAPQFAENKRPFLPGLQDRWARLRTGMR